MNPTSVTVNGADVTNVAVTCAATYTVGGTIAGLTGTGLVLQDNGGDNLTETAGSTSYTFATQLLTSAAYAVTVQTQPSGQFCTVANPSGTIAAANVSNVAVTCRNLGKFAYAVDTGAGVLSSFSISPTDGSLTYVSSAAVDGGAATPAPVSVAFATVTGTPATPTRVYTADQNTATISIYSADTSGNLTFLSAVSTGTAGVSTPAALAIDPTRAYLILADSQNGTVPGTGQLVVYTIDPSLGGLTPSAPVATDANPGNNTSDAVIDASGQYVFATNAYDPTDGVAAYTFAAGALTPFTAPYTPAGNLASWVTVDPSGQWVYVSNTIDGTISVYTLNKTNGTLAPITTTATATCTANGVCNVGTGSSPNAISIDPTSHFLYVTDSATGAGHGDVVGFNISQTDGSLSPLTGSPFAAGVSNQSGPVPITSDPSGHFVYVGSTLNGDGSITEFNNDLTTGLLTPVTGSPLTYNDAGGPPTTTPALGTNALAIQ